MATDFFERQALARRQSAWLIAGFVLAILLVSLAFTFILLGGTSWLLNNGVGQPSTLFSRWPRFAMTVGTLVTSTIVLAVIWKLWKLREGGGAVAQSLGGVLVSRSASDLKQKRLLNVVEEMALAAHVPVPKVYLLAKESGINAFAAGLSPETAAIGVTAGALEKFDRDELQAVIGHEFSHILNGDMVINTRMIAGLFGLYVITDCARAMLEKRKESRSSRKRGGRIWVIVYAIYIVGSIGLFVGRLLQAAVSRRREELADASAVQFTRNPQALQSAFVKIAAAADGANLEAAGAADMAHLFFASTDIGWISKLTSAWFSTHPPLAERAQALDVNLTPSKFRRLVADEKRAAERDARMAAEAAQSSSAPPVPAVGSAITGAVVAASVLAGTIAAPTAAATPQPVRPRLRTAAESVLTSGDPLRNRLPLDQQGAIASLLDQIQSSPDCQQAAVLSLLCASDPAQQRAQFAKVLPLLGPRVIHETQKLLPAVAALAPVARLPVVLAVLPSLLQAPEATRLRLVKLAQAFAAAVKSVDSQRFAVSRIVLQSLLLRPEPDGDALPLTADLEAVGVVCSLLAMDSGAKREEAYAAGMQNLLPPQNRPAQLSVLPDARAIDAALSALRPLHTSAKRALGEAFARIIAYDKRLTAAEANYLRVLCLSIGSALPALPLNTLVEMGSEPVRSAATG